MTDEPDNIIHFRPEHLEFEPKRKTLAMGACAHNECYTDEARRILECIRCGATVEAFDFLHDLAMRGERIRWSIKRLREMEKELETRVEELKKEERNTKARLRNARKRTE